MNKRQEKVLIATLCGLVLTAAGGLAVQPATATASGIGHLAQVSGPAQSDQVTLRK
ncbi:hypothetical protein [uncultured Devosia sp.]|uniref:hypothetical protein n=1 Tax=uncultured Devosia sp. TaxID=211434 RepID=UPI0035CC1F7F